MKLKNFISHQPHSSLMKEEQEGGITKKPSKRRKRWSKFYDKSLNFMQWIDHAGSSSLVYRRINQKLMFVVEKSDVGRK